MNKAELERLAFPELLALFLSGQVETLWQNDNDNENLDAFSVSIGNRLWNEMSSISDISPLFYSEFESCLFWATYIVWEEGVKGCELMDLMMMVSGSQFSSVRENVCRSLYICWNMNYVDILINFLRDDIALVKDNALAILAKIPDNSFSALVEKVESGDESHQELKYIIKYFTALRLGKSSDLERIAMSSDDEPLIYFHKAGNLR